MTHYNLALLGFGNVGRAFARLLLRKRNEMLTQYNLTCQVTGIYTTRHGAAIHPAGLDLVQALASHRNAGQFIARFIFPTATTGCYRLHPTLSRGCAL
jgi:homoserine dehydrogenase